MAENKKEIELIEIGKPTPKCKRCKVYLIKRSVPYFGMVYDCPKCQTYYREVKDEI